MDDAWAIISSYAWPLLSGFLMLVAIFVAIAMIDRHPRSDDRRRRRR